MKPESFTPAPALGLSASADTIPRAAYRSEIPNAHKIEPHAFRAKANLVRLKNSCECFSCRGTPLRRMQSGGGFFFCPICRGAPAGKGTPVRIRANARRTEKRHTGEALPALLTSDQSQPGMPTAKSDAKDIIRLSGAGRGFPPFGRISEHTDAKPSVMIRNSPRSRQGAAFRQFEHFGGAIDPTGTQS